MYIMCTHVRYPTVNYKIFARVLFSRNFAYVCEVFVKIRPSRNGEITLSFTYKDKSCISLTSQICLLRPFAKIKFSRKFPNLQYYLEVAAVSGNRYD